MNADNRLSTALHALLHLPPDGGPMTSQALATCLRTNPVVVRRSLGGLREAGLVRSKKGPGGGWSIARELGAVSLRDVHVAVGEPALVAIGLHDPEPACAVAAAVRTALEEASGEAESLLSTRLASVSLARLSEDVGRHVAARGGRTSSHRHDHPHSHDDHPHSHDDHPSHDHRHSHDAHPDHDHGPHDPSSQEVSLVERAFGAERAAVYDNQSLPWRAFKDALHLLIRAQLAHLPSDARILVAGAGTGAEVRFLAPLFPGWRFTLVDPSEPMLAVARRHAERERFVERCRFHAGYLDSAPAERHHAALSVLVSHFLPDASNRRAFFQEIAARLEPGGLLFTADLCANPEDPSFEPALELWLRLLDQGGAVPPERARAYGQIFGREVAAHGPGEVEAILAEAGFPAPVACFQMALVRAWVARLRLEGGPAGPA